MTPTPAWAAYDGGTITAEVDRRLALHAAAVLTPDCPDLPAEEAPVTTLNAIVRFFKSCWHMDKPNGGTR